MKEISTRFVGKPERVSIVFFTYFDNFFQGQYKLGELRGTRRGLNPPPDKSSTERNLEELN